jgi:hypothetical protein
MASVAVGDTGAGNCESGSVTVANAGVDETRLSFRLFVWENLDVGFAVEASLAVDPLLSLLLLVRCNNRVKSPGSLGDEGARGVLIWVILRVAIVHAI